MGDRNQRFEGTCCLHVQGKRIYLKMEAACPSEKLIPVSQSVQRYTIYEITGKTNEWEINK
jgi:hypothetical protein